MLFFFLLVCTFKKGCRIFEVKVDVQKGPLSFSFNKITFRCYYCLSFNDMCLKVSYYKLHLKIKKKAVNNFLLEMKVECICH